MKETIKETLLKGKRKLLDEEQNESRRSEQQSEISKKLVPYFDKTTEEFVSDLLNELIIDRFKSKNKEILSISFDTHSLSEYFTTEQNSAAKRGFIPIIQEVLYKISLRPDWVSSSILLEEELFALAYYCGYFSYESFAGTNYVINFGTFLEMIKELGLEYDNNTLSITRDNLDKLLMSVEEKNDSKKKAMGK